MHLNDTGPTRAAARNPIHRQPHPRVFAPLVPLTLALGTFFSVPVAAALEPVLADPATGREIRAIQPPLRFDHQHVRVELDIPAWPPTSIDATTTLTLDAVGRARHLIELDAKGLDISEVRLKGSEIAFTHENGLLSFRSPEPRHPGRPFQVEIDYAITSLDPDGLGLSLYPSDLGEGNWVLSSQGQTDHNSRWFPHRDAPDDVATVELVVRTPADLQILANGTPTGRRIHRDGTATVTHTLDTPHPLYLTAVAVGHWVTLSMPDPVGAMLMRVYTERPLSDSDRAVLEQTGPMLRYFELIFDEPYAWDAYDQVFLPGVTWSMEHTSISFMDADMLGNPTRTQDTVAHELAHHWFGDLVTCRDWGHLWLNEGLATYCELLWAEQEARRNRQPVEQARDRLLTEFRDDVFGEGPGSFPGRRGIVNHRFGEADEMFGQPDSPYSKGAYIIHMLREMLGDRVFFNALAGYIDRHRHDSVTTHDLRRAFERASGLSLEWFFDQWTGRAGYPVVEATTRIADDSVTIDFRQTQTIDADNPAYRLRVPVVLTSASGVQVTEHADFDTRTHRHSIVTPFAAGETASVAIDPDRAVLMDLRQSVRSTTTPTDDTDSETP